MIWTFTLHLKNFGEMTVEAANRLYSAGCDDGSPSSSKGKSVIDFDRESTTLQSAIRSAIADVRKAGFDVDRVEIESSELQESALSSWPESASQ